MPSCFNMYPSCLFPKLSVSRSVVQTRCLVVLFANRGSIIQDIEKLQQLDGEKVTKEEKKDAGYAVSSDDDDAEDDDITSDGTTKTETRPAGKWKPHYLCVSWC